MFVREIVLHHSDTVRGECSSKVVECVDSTQRLSSIESLFSSIARTSSITFETKSGRKRDLRHNDDKYRGGGECGGD